MDVMTIPDMDRTLKKQPKKKGMSIPGFSRMTRRPSKIAALNKALNNHNFSLTKKSKIMQNMKIWKNVNFYLVGESG